MCRKVTFLIFYSRTQFIEEFHFYSAVVRDEPHPSGEHGHRSLQFSPVNSGSLERCSVFPGGTWSVGTPVYNLVWTLWFARCYGWREAGQAPSLLGFLLGVLIIPHSRNRRGAEATHISLSSLTLPLSPDSFSSPGKWDGLHSCAAGKLPICYILLLFHFTA